MPPSAACIRPIRSARASVKAPFTWPNSSLSNRFSETAPRSTETRTWSARRERRWSSRATSSLPVPFSPRMRTLASVGPARSISDQIRAIAGESPSSGVSPPPAGAAIASTLRRSVTTSAREVRKRGGGADGGEQPLVRPGLGDEIGGAALHRLDRDADAGMGGDHHHHRLRVALQYFGEPVEALGGVGRAAAEIGVEQDGVGQLAAPSPPAPRPDPGRRRRRRTGRAAAAARTERCPDRRR